MPRERHWAVLTLVTGWPVYGNWICESRHSHTHARTQAAGDETGKRRPPKTPFPVTPHSPLGTRKRRAQPESPDSTASAPERSPLYWLSAALDENWQYSPDVMTLRFATHGVRPLPETQQLSWFEYQSDCSQARFQPRISGAQASSHKLAALICVVITFSCSEFCAAVPAPELDVALSRKRSRKWRPSVTQWSA